MNAIGEGVVVGVSAGLITSLIMGLFSLLKHGTERRNQRIHLFKTISHFRNEIYRAVALEPSGDLPSPPSKQDVQRALFNEFRRQLEVILQGRSSRLSFDEVHSVSDVFFTDRFPPEIKVKMQLDDAHYNRIFDALQSIKWLKLPPRAT